MIRDLKKRGFDLDNKPLTLRLVKHKIADETYVYATTLIGEAYPKTCFAEIYHGRWGIEELYKISKQGKKENRRIIAVGTTTLRALESNLIANSLNGQISKQLINGGFETNMFIRPGFKFQIVYMLVTNFHLPKSTLFMLFCAFAGYQEIKDIYKYAIDKKMRFFSYGEATLLYIIPA